MSPDLGTEKSVTLLDLRVRWYWEVRPGRAGREV